MNEKKTNRSRIIGLRLSPDEYTRIEKRWKSSTSRKLSDYVRRVLLDKPIVTTYRDKSLDDFMAEAMKLRAELNSIGNNFNQAVHKLHMSDTSSQIKVWILSQQAQQKNLLAKVEEIKFHIKKIAEKWLA